MKRIFASAGMVAVGAAGLHAANVGDLSPEQAGRQWNVSAALRGFYDDNFATRPSGQGKEGSGGINFAPTASISLPLDQTFLSASYSLSLLYYFDRPGDEIDHNHTVDLKLDHKFTERHRLRMQETFVYSREPELLDQGGAVTTFRNEADGIRNTIPIEFEWQLTRLFYTVFGYQNSYYHYFQDGDGSYAALLNRFEHLFRAELGYQLQQNNSVSLGYQFGITEYTSDDLLAPGGLPASTRDTQSHYVYGGYQHRLSSYLSFALRLGGRFTEYTELGDNDTSPYVDFNVNYQYLPGNNLTLGVKQDHNSTDIAGAGQDPDDIVRDQDSTTAYLNVTHRLTSLLTASGHVQYQHSVYNGGDFDGDADDYLSLGVTLAYQITRNWSAEIEYDFTKLLSDVPGRDFSRNIVYGGVRFTF